MPRIATAALAGALIGAAVLIGAAAAHAADDPVGSLTVTLRSSYVLVDFGPSDPPRDVYHLFRSRNGTARQHIDSATDGRTWLHDRLELRRGSLYCYQVSHTDPVFGLYRTERDCVRWR